MLADLPNAAGRSGAISLYSNATWRHLRLLLVVGIVIVVVLNTIRHRSQVRRLLGVIAVNGVVHAAFAMVQWLTWNGKIYWVVPVNGGIRSAGAFVNYSHYAQFMNLSIGAGLALLMIWLSELFENRRLQIGYVAARLSDAGARKCWWLVGGLVIAATSVFASLSRMGMLSLLAAGILTAIIVVVRRTLRPRGWVLAVMATATLACVLWVGFDAVCDRLATVEDPLKAAKSRIDILKDISVMVGKFPVLGTGLGTHEVVYPMFKDGIRPGLIQYAENEYAQAGEETGAIGLVIVLGFAALVVGCYIRGVRFGRGPMVAGIVGLGFGLCAVALHSLSDFGQRVPANACLTAVTCALVLIMSQSVIRKKRDGGRLQTDPNWHTGSDNDAKYISVESRALLGLVGAGIILWMALTAVQAYIGERHWDEAHAVEQQLVRTAWRGSDETYEKLIVQAELAVEAQPHNVKYRHWLNVYRWRGASRLRDEDGNIMLGINELETMTDVVADLNRAREDCPTFGPTYSILGQIERFILNEPVGEQHIRLAYRLNASDATVCYVVGHLNVELGNYELAVERFARCLTIAPEYFSDIERIFLVDLNRPADLVKICEDRADWLLHVASKLSLGKKEPPPLAAEARSQAVALMEGQINSGKSTPHMLVGLARAYMQDGRSQRAIEYYRRALDNEYGNVRWRYLYAVALADTGRQEEALREAKVCLRLRPAHR
ncbi:MAG: O-antigen ligase family protein, partial [Phycisphaerae bacterium]|nr:O-antigen ligase family protein [Phycisphaerae bacterium]